MLTKNTNTNPLFAFGKRIGDTPTDALQLVNKKYVDEHGSSVFVGYITGATGAPVFPLPTGWSSSKTGTGAYTITHNLGTTSYGVVVSPVGSGGGATPVSFGSNSFPVFTFNTLTGSATNLDFSFILSES